MAEVRRPPVLRLRHHFTEVILHGCQVEALELFSIVKTLTHRIGFGRMLMQDINVQLVWPPVLVRVATALFMSLSLHGVCIIYHNFPPFVVCIYGPYCHEYNTLVFVCLTLADF